jgi:hypothetical protein
MRTVFSLILFVFIHLQLEGYELTLKNKLAEAPLNSYVVLEQNKTYTFLHIYDKTPTSIVIEEISLPGSCKSQPWRTWFESGAVGHTSWTRSRINLVTGHFEESYSLSKGNWIDTSSGDTFMATLLNLPFTAVLPEDRRKIGLPPGYGKRDMRPFWNPRLVVEGYIIPGVPFTAWKARWPGDGSELSYKIIELYLPENPSPDYPSFFPYWFEVEGKLGSAKLRVVDSGFNAKGPQN